MLRWFGWRSNRRGRFVHYWRRLFWCGYRRFLALVLEVWVEIFEVEEMYARAQQQTQVWFLVLTRVAYGG